MCLLITQAANVIWTPADIKDFFSRNQDGLGMMWAEGGNIVVNKVLPKDEVEAVDFIMGLQGKDCAIHFRMKTHGDINLEQCHPYELLDASSEHPMWLMHNGILDTGNHADKTKSDTWHFIRDYLRSLLDPKQGGDPSLIFKPAFQEILGGMIGSSNKFVVMDYTGATATINKHAGVMHNGAWLSNQYAWSAPRSAPSRKVTSAWENSYTTGKGYSYGHGHNSWDLRSEYDEDETVYNTGVSKTWKDLDADAKKAADYLSAAEAEDERLSNLQEKQLEDVYSQLDFIECDDAYRDLGTDTILNYIRINTEGSLWDALDALTSRVVSESEFIAHVDAGSRKKIAYMAVDGYENEEEDLPINTVQ